MDGSGEGNCALLWDQTWWLWFPSVALERFVPLLYVKDSILCLSSPIHCKKRLNKLTKLSLAGNIPMVSLVSVITAGDGKIVNLFCSVQTQTACTPNHRCKITEFYACTEAEFLEVIETKSLESFPPCYSQSPLLTDFTTPPPTTLEQKGFETGL